LVAQSKTCTFKSARWYPEHHLACAAGVRWVTQPAGLASGELPKLRHRTKSLAIHLCPAAQLYRDLLPAAQLYRDLL